MLKGKTLNLRIMEKEDLALFVEWSNDPRFLGEFWDFTPAQRSKAEMEKMLEEDPFDQRRFIIEKRDGTKIGLINHFNMLHPLGKLLEIGFAVVPEERRKGNCTEAVQLMVDYLFLSKNVERIQASTHIENRASRRVLEKTGFKKEGVLRKAFFNKGRWNDGVTYSVLREEWEKPRILTRVY